MVATPSSVQSLIEAFNELPGVGPKTAERYAHALLQMTDSQRDAFSHAVRHVRDDVTQCSSCCGLFDTNPCTTCADRSRDDALLMVVSESTDVAPIEHTGAYRGQYHVLGGALNPIEGVTADQLTFRELRERVEHGSFREIIVATNPDLDGEATAIALTKLLSGTKVTVTRLGLGLPMGSTVEYADEITLTNALRGRQPLGAEPPPSPSPDV